MSHAIHNDIGHEFEGEGGILSRILGIIGPFESVAKILIPCHQNADAALRIKDGEHLGNLAGGAVFRLFAFGAFRDRVIRHLNDFVYIVEAMK